MDLSHAELQTILRMLPEGSRFVMAVLHDGQASTFGNVGREAMAPVLRALADSFESGQVSVRVMMKPHAGN
jgi:hypothetical protein